MIQFIPAKFYYDQLDRINVKVKAKMQAQDTAEQWVSVDQVAQHLNVKTFTIYKWLERKDMPAHKVGRLWRFKITEIDEWVRAGGSANKETTDE